LSCEARAADAECPIRVSLHVGIFWRRSVLDILVALNRHHPFPTALSVHLHQVSVLRRGVHSKMQALEHESLE
jgi:hypothetical protein